VRRRNQIVTRESSSSTDFVVAKQYKGAVKNTADDWNNTAECTEEIHLMSEAKLDKHGNKKEVKKFLTWNDCAKSFFFLILFFMQGVDCFPSCRCH